MAFLGPKAPSGAQMLVSGALRRQRPAFTKLATFLCAKHSQNHAKHSQNMPKPLKSGFDPKVKSSKMGLSIIPRQFL